MNSGDYLHSKITLKSSFTKLFGYITLQVKEITEDIGLKIT